MPEILKAIQENGLAIVALVLVSTALVVVVRAFYKELIDRRVRAEALTDTLIETFDEATTITKAALDELRKR
jgi:hypothetical protein